MTNQNPEVGELWEVLMPSRQSLQKRQQLRLVKKTEMTYSFSDPDTDPYCPILIHIRIEDCKLVQRIPEKEFTRINGIPDTYYEQKNKNTGPSVNSSSWSIDKSKYLSGNTSPN